jgi:hypothetical protein
MPRWHVSFTVANRDQTVVDAKRFGAQVLSPSETEWTRTALIRDPQGADFTASQFTPRRVIDPATEAPGQMAAAMGRSVALQRP